MRCELLAMAASGRSLPIVLDSTSVDQLGRSRPEADNSPSGHSVFDCPRKLPPMIMPPILAAA